MIFELTKLNEFIILFYFILNKKERRIKNNSFFL